MDYFLLYTESEGIQIGYRKIENLYRSKDILLFKQCYASEKVHGCLHKDTLIMMKDGTEKKIADILPNDEVVVYNEKKEFDVRVVESVVRQYAIKGWLKLILESGRIMILTEDHQILTKKGWKPAKELSLTDELISC